MILNFFNTLLDIFKSDEKEIELPKTIGNNLCKHLKNIPRKPSVSEENMSLFLKCELNNQDCICKKMLYDGDMMAFYVNFYIYFDELEINNCKDYVNMYNYYEIPYNITHKG
jgi:hypothetical protein